MATIPARVKGIDHVVLRVTDIDRTIAFYQDILGLPLERIFDRIGLYQFRAGSSLIDVQPLKEGDTLAPPAERGVEHVCLNIEGDLDEVLAALAAQGITPSFGPLEVYGAHGFGTSFYLRDPDGYEIELKVGYARNPVRMP
ncbi:VOC family protein [Acuticoccus mangrovi]|uniref:VOC family protein n=1 Tax=Acuticoccus mangrovi TaxID=2796142 RepID=A0A934MNE9_9HYPH|nr:VOC family protein [Acuticoccus mangrovi]MBJ3778124.1 VOC family protein [Acuticoccus mangrovi]